MWGREPGRVWAGVLECLRRSGWVLGGFFRSPAHVWHDPLTWVSDGSISFAGLFEKMSRHRLHMSYMTPSRLRTGGRDHVPFCRDLL